MSDVQTTDTAEKLSAAGALSALFGIEDAEEPGKVLAQEFARYLAAGGTMSFGIYRDLDDEARDAMAAGGFMAQIEGQVATTLAQVGALPVSRSGANPLADAKLGQAIVDGTTARMQRFKLIPEAWK